MCTLTIQSYLLCVLIEVYLMKYALSVAASDSHWQIQVDGQGRVKCVVNDHIIARTGTLLLSELKYIGGSRGG